MSARGHAERARGVLLRTLDLTEVQAEADRAIDEGETARIGHAPYAAAEHDGHLYVVCEEGVGWEVTDEDPLLIDTYVSTGTGIGIFPRFQVVLSPAEVRAAATGDEVDLADLIRTFGSRLEANFWVWHRTLTTPVTQEVNS